MIIVANRFQVADGYEDAFVERFEDSMGGVEDRPGFVRFELLTPASDDTDTFVAMTHWESKEAFEAWTDSEAFRESHSGETPDGMFEGHPELEIHEVAFERTP
ncbi:antibiotic biosynthesis monooxygenase family protein [Halobacteriaceae archaeon GCM10025711]